MITAVRISLALSAPFNAGAAALLAFPQSAAARALGLAAEVPPLHAYLLGYMVLAFGVVYLWQALRDEPHRPLLLVSALAKAGVFFIVVGLWLANAAPGLAALMSCGDLAFALLWLAWLWQSRTQTDTSNALH